eukprot:CAMPEP_0179206360 /NCGR_PEP_ID=MMETSP0796-20121207/102895_1 /TAXON_ID=73915 /ORGANISM="Pyrodinium bahamense, Strain pbaha01" /LENGTH=195 /DNA_ID=CAMNT_0020911279 /DNA_START=64 /DNA_END=647 /DNA_ORIENTATION=-
MPRRTAPCLAEMTGPRNDKYNKLNFAKRRFSDEDLSQLPLRQKNYTYDEVDFSENRLSSDGLRVVLDLCLRCQKLRILKLYKNQIDDHGADQLAKLCEQCPSIEEIHLSHNKFTGDGVERIISAAERARPANAPPLWLRLYPCGFIHSLQKCFSICERLDPARCTNKTCWHKRKIHLPFFHLQQKPGRSLNEDRP